jgi:peptidase S41-like protein
MRKYLHAHPSVVRLATTAALLVALDVAGASSAFDAKPWLEDLEQSRAAIRAKYANLEWAVFEREADLPALFEDAKARVESSSSELEARAAFDRLARRIGDGHLRFIWPSQSAIAHSSVPSASCAELGYDARMRGAPAAALLPGYTPLADPQSKEFPAGMLEAAGRRIGVVKIGLFSPKGYPELCEAALTALKIAPRETCDDICADRIEAWASSRMTQDLMAQIRALRAAGAVILLVDLVGNGGGSEWAEAAARMVSAVRLKSNRVNFVRGKHWTAAFFRMEAELRAAIPDADGHDQPLLLDLAAAVAGRRREAEVLCDSAPIWQGMRPKCQWLGEGFFSSGLMDSADPAELRGKSWASLVFTPMRYPFEEGVWRGPLIVLVDGSTGSAAEQFTALLQDNGVASVMGAPTAGAGCGHTNGGTPTTLKNSGATLELPDCVRLRKDGSNEVMGIEPDVLVGLRPQDGPHRIASRIALKLPDAVLHATRMKQP